MTITIRRVTELSPTHRSALADLLIDCVHAGASVSFMAPLSRDKALSFWDRVAVGVEHNERALLIALDPDERIVGTVHLVLDLPENQPHRADVAKLLVHPSARRRGTAAALIQALEDVARAEGKTLLVLDTVTGEAGERLYARLSWTRVGSIPGYALMPDGVPCATTVFFRPIPGGG